MLLVDEIKHFNPRFILKNVKIIHNSVRAKNYSVKSIKISNFVFVDINECKENTHLCSPNSICHNLPGSYKCSCLEGFTKTGFECIDINECSANQNICKDIYHECINTVGGYKCQCLSGFVTDINEICIGNFKSIYLQDLVN